MNIKADEKDTSRNVEWENNLVKKLEAVLGVGFVERDFQESESWLGPRIGAPLFWIDCEYGEKASLEETLERASRFCDLERPVLAICQTPRKRPKVAMFLEDFLKLLAKTTEAKKER